MNNDDLKQLWQQQLIPATGDVSVLVAETRRKHGKFRRTIFWRDFREAGLAIVMIPLWLRGAVHHRALWTYYLMVPALLFIAGFLIIDRLRRRKKTAPPDGTVVESLTAAAEDVEHQIWLLGHVQWWYVGPIAGALAAGTIHKMLLGYLALPVFISDLAVNLLIAGGVWWLNHAVVKRDLKPRLAELQRLIAGLREL